MSGDREDNRGPDDRDCYPDPRAGQGGSDRRRDGGEDQNDAGYAEGTAAAQPRPFPGHDGGGKRGQHAEPGRAEPGSGDGDRRHDQRG